MRLGQFLKLADLVDTGGEARTLIQGGHVRVDGEVETRRGRQLQLGQRVTVALPGRKPITVVVADH
ncbi:RNA-binding S4 domain-containing protein [Raineyella sp. LH-20]|uniref:RNA-binding S4 domain-containing protein n=1 Tax=Raineyella sp. LH-20 TaxID=3081204 RepID=UPI002953D2FA|nr:RNA-binding S4 domain-containing protein [Raineyella sp. LH-20]WOP20204.1 RNA-binding S4 domain-containing protein [Raineyella sp. LH-20]